MTGKIFIDSLCTVRIWRFIRISHGILYAGGGARRQQAKRMIQRGAVEAFMDPEDEDDDDAAKETKGKKRLTKEEIRVAEDL